MFDSGLCHQAEGGLPVSMRGLSGISSCLLLASAFVVSACNSKSHQSGAQQPPQGKYSGQAYAGKMAPDDGQWIRPAKDYASTRYSTLDQINNSNVKNLSVA